MIHDSVGNINESDVLLASASKAIIIGFNVKVDPAVQKMAEAKHVEIRIYNVIYELTKEVRAAMSGMLEPTIEEEKLARPRLARPSRCPSIGLIAGCYGDRTASVVRNEQVRIRRRRAGHPRGQARVLRHLKDEAREMAQGFECGIYSQGFPDYQEGDIIECYTLKKAIARAV